MGSLKHHSKCHKLCPELPFSIPANIVLTSTALLHLPLILPLGPLLYTLYMTCFTGIPNLFRYLLGQQGRGCCCATFLTLLLALFPILPLALLGGVLASVLITALGIIPILFWTLSYLLRLVYHYGRLVLC